LADEVCDPYAQRQTSDTSAFCNTNTICNDWQNRVWKVSDFEEIRATQEFQACPKSTLVNEEQFKRFLIEKGPLYSGISTWYHAMVLIGYGGRSNWSTVDFWPSNYLCDPIHGFVPSECTTIGEEKTICNNSFYDNGSSYSALYKYKCSNIPGGSKEWVFQNSLSCGPGMKCVNNQCQPGQNFQLTTGHRECSSYNLDTHYFQELVEYSPGAGENYWLFKNSWGSNWGEDGYARVAVSLENLSYGAVPIGPFTPPLNHSYWPSGFDNQIKCVDKDNDTYCNWGISAIKSSTCPSFCKPEKDCDDSNPNLGPFDENLNCIQLRLQPNLYLGWNKISWPNFVEAALPEDCLQYSYVRNNYWEGKAVSYGFPIDNLLLGLTNFFIKCQ
jgi:hypothetical protein